MIAAGAGTPCGSRRDGAVGGATALSGAAEPRLERAAVESSRPGELLCQDTFFVGRLKGVGKVHLHAVVDTFGSVGFGFLHTSKQPEAAVAVLHNEVLPFYAERDLPVGAGMPRCGGTMSKIERRDMIFSYIG